MKSIILTTTTILCFFGFSLSQTDRIRLCVPDTNYDDCVRLSDNWPGKLSCINARDKFECMRLIDREEADLINIDAEDLYLGGRIYNLEPLVIEEYGGKYIYKHRAGVLVPKNSDIGSLADFKGKRACLSGFGESIGWNIPIGILLATNTLVPDCRDELYSVEQFFGRSCAPGKWSADELVDHELKRKHPNLCSICKDPLSCSSSDPFAGPEGTIKCLTEGQGQLAFVSIESVDLYFRNRPAEREQFQFLCLDGSRMKIDAKTNENACEWAKQPSNVFVIKKGKGQRLKEYYIRFVQGLFYRYSQRRPSWFTKAFVSSDNVTQLISVPFSMNDWDKYLGNYIPSIEKPLIGCERKNITFCVGSSSELAKCLELQKVSYARGIRPQIRCHRTDSRQACIEAVNNRKADLVTLDASDFYHAARYDNLIPLAMEQSENMDYAIALVRVQSDITSLSQLRGFRSCHTGFGKQSGWIAPVGTLIEERLIPGQDCDRAKEISEFFSSSCVPGAADSRIHINGSSSGVEKLCQQCIGGDNNQHVCELSRAEKYYGEEGAMRCLVEGRGDVAFVSHKTPLRFIDGKSSAPWAFFLRSSDFRLLCRERDHHSDRESNHRLGQLNDFRHCHLAKLPGRIVATTSLISNDTKFDALQVLVSLSDMFSHKVPMSFRLFGPFRNESNQIFSDDTFLLKAVPFDSSYKQVFDEQFLKYLEYNDIQVCASSAQAHHHYSNNNNLMVKSLLLLLLCTLLSKFIH